MRIVGLACQIIQVYLVEPGELDKKRKGNVPVSVLVVAVCVLGNVEILGDFPLTQVPVYPKLFEPVQIHDHHLIVSIKYLTM